jgi:hypothetical protein
MRPGLAGSRANLLSVRPDGPPNAFDVTLTNLAGEKTGYQANRSVEQPRRSIRPRLETSARSETNFIVRPRSTTVTLIQFDDLDLTLADRVAPRAVLMLLTSPGEGGTGNFQAWVAVKDTPMAPLAQSVQA